MPARLSVAVGEVEAGRLDDVDGEAEAGGHAQDGAGVAGDIGLVERDAEGWQEADRDQSCRTATLVRRATTAGLSGWSFVAECGYSGAIVNANRAEADMEFMMTVDIHRPTRGRYA